MKKIIFIFKRKIWSIFLFLIVSFSLLQASDFINFNFPAAKKSSNKSKTIKKKKTKIKKKSAAGKKKTKTSLTQSDLQIIYNLLTTHKTTTTNNTTNSLTKTNTTITTNTNVSPVGNSVTVTTPLTTVEGSSPNQNALSSSGGGSSLSANAIAGIVAGSVGGAVLLTGSIGIAYKKFQELRAKANNLEDQINSLKQVVTQIEDEPTQVQQINSSAVDTAFTIPSVSSTPQTFRVLDESQTVELVDSLTNQSTPLNTLLNNPRSARIELDNQSTSSFLESEKAKIPTNYPPSVKKQLKQINEATGNEKYDLVENLLEQYPNYVVDYPNFVAKNKAIIEEYIQKNPSYLDEPGIASVMQKNGITVSQSSVSNKQVADSDSSVAAIELAADAAKSGSQAQEDSSASQAQEVQSNQASSPSEAEAAAKAEIEKLDIQKSDAEIAQARSENNVSDSETRPEELD